MEISLVTRVNRIAFAGTLMGELVEIVIVRGPAVSTRITGLMVTHGRHERHLAQELCTGGEEIVVPVAVIALGRDEIAVHERDIAIEIADEILHVRPVITGITVDIADGEDTESGTLLRSGLGAANFIEPAGSAGTDREVIAGVGLQVREGNDMHKAFVGYVPSVGREDRLVKVRRIGTVKDEGIGRFGLIRHLPKDLDGGSGRRHRVRLLIRYVGFAGRIVFVFRNAPPRIAERTVVRSGVDRRAVGIELEITVIRIHEIGIAYGAVRLRSTGTHFDRRIITDTVMYVGVGAIDGKTVGIIPLFGIHEDTVGDMRIVDIRRIDPAFVGAVVEGTMVDDHRSFQRLHVTTRIDVNKPSGTISSAIESTVDDKDVLHTRERVINIDRAIAVGRLGAHAEDTIAYAEVDRLRSVHLNQVIGTMELHALERKVRIDLDPFGDVYHRIRSFLRFDSQRHGCSDGSSLIVLTGG